MLTISKPLNAGQAQTYHAKEFTSAEQNYWQQSGAVLGEWQGKLAESFGLTGGVDAQHFTRLSEGQHPYTAEQLVRHRTGQEYTTADGAVVKPVEHRAGWDTTFSAPKSVSLTALVGGDDRVREAHRAAVTTALTELERYTQARIGGNNPAEMTGKFVAAKFEHDTARPVDGYAAPQLHTHAVIFNMTERENGSTRALQPRGFFDSQQFATAVYQAELTYRLRHLGYQLETGRSGAPEIKGYTAEYLEASSPRSQQIRQYLEASGFQGPAAAQIAAHGTRDKKEIHKQGEAVAAHRKVAAEFGNQAARVVADARARALEQPSTRIPDPQSKSQEAVTYAKQRGFEREAVSDERLLMRDALRRGMGDVTYSQVRQNFDQRISAGEFQAVDHHKHATGRQFTTPETIAMERAAVAQISFGRTDLAPILGAEQAAALAAARPHLNDGQRNAIEQILTSTERVQGLQGLAGTGKTTTLEVVREGAERGGYAVQGFAPTSKASNQLREAGVSAQTLQGFLAQHSDRSTDPQSRRLYLLDESSLASTRQMRDFLDRVGPHDRVVVIGDTRQHQGVDAGKPFEQMQDAGMRTVQLDQIVRQQDPALLAAVERLSRNDTVAGVQMLQQQGRVTEIPEAERRIKAIAKEYSTQPEKSIIVSPDNASRRELNQAVRVELQDKGIVSRDNHLLPTLIPRSELTGADRQWAARYQEGDILHYNKGSKEHGLPKGSYATVTAVDAAANQITVQREDGLAVTYDPKRLQGVSSYQEINRDFAKGDRIQFAAPSRDLDVVNRQLAIILKIDDGHVIAKLDGPAERIVAFEASKMRHFDHGYAVTSQSSQGITAERVLVNLDTRAHPELINTRFAYVAVSRASHDAQIYTNDASNLGQRLSHNVTKSSAVDFRQEQPQPPTQRQEPTLQNPSRERALRPENTPAVQKERIYTPAEHERHYAPLNRELHPEDARHFGWRAETGTVQSYMHSDTRRHIHIDGPTGQFYDQQSAPISRDAALEQAIPPGQRHAPQEMIVSRSNNNSLEHGQIILL